MTEKRKKAIRKRNTFLILTAVVLIAAIALIILIVKMIMSAANPSGASSVESSVASAASSESPSSAVSSVPEPETVTLGGFTLDVNYSNLMLVNGSNPLPEGFDYEGHLTTIDDKYINGSLKQIDKDVYPYMQAMIEGAWADGVKLYVWSPYRSYDTQNMLFKKQVQRCITNGTAADMAEAQAATVVARPGTSEHNTGLAADFNMASDQFETTPMYTWLQEHAAEYGFIMRYAKDKTDKTGVIYESWHYRFVGIKAAKEIKALGMCLEEYLEYLNK